jgi:crossover junction endodeoxyribonuclease RusA
MIKKGTTFPIYLRSFKEIYSKFRAVTHPSDESRAYVATIKEMAIQRGFMFNLDKPVRIDIVVCPRDRREIDAHNYSKVLLDALEQAQVIIDDSQAIDVRTRLGPVIKGGRVVVSMWEISTDPHDVLKEAWQ